MKIPVIDNLIDRQLRSKPQKVTAYIERTLIIPKGANSGIVEIPCSLFISDFALTFPSGIKYIYGDSEEEDESKEVTYRTCPAITVSLPDVADKDVEVPLIIGFDENPKNKVKSMKVETALSFAFVISVAILSVTMSITLAVCVPVVLWLAIYQLRLVLRVNEFWKKVQVKEC